LVWQKLVPSNCNIGGLGGVAETNDISKCWKRIQGEDGGEGGFTGECMVVVYNWWAVVPSVAWEVWHHRPLGLLRPGAKTCHWSGHLRPVNMEILGRYATKINIQTEIIAKRREGKTTCPCK